MDPVARFSLGDVKNNQVSEQCRKEGNQFYIQGDYFEAFSRFNLALCYAEPESVALGLAYYNRAAAFLSVQQYKACLQNIQLARDNNYPSVITFKLDELEKKYKLTMASHAGPIEEIWNDFYKLTYKPNPKAPFLTECIELKKHKHGLMLATNRDLKAGDIIAITEPLFRMPYHTEVYRCYYCLADRFMNFVPCPGCSIAMFCDEKCWGAAMKEFHQFICGTQNEKAIYYDSYGPLRMALKCVSLFDGSRQELDKFLAKNKKKLHTPFDFDLSDIKSSQSQKNMMLIQLSKLQHLPTFSEDINHKFTVAQDYMESIPPLRNIITREFFEKLFKVQHCNMQSFKSIDNKKLVETSFVEDVNLFTTNFYGSAIEICHNFLLHSCASNLILQSYNGKFVWIVMHPIKAGEFLTISKYSLAFYDKSLETRKAEFEGLIRRCECLACTHGWQTVKMSTLELFVVVRRSSENTIAEIKKLFAQINLNFKPVNSKFDKNLWNVISTIRWSLYNVGKATFWNEIPPIDFKNVITSEQALGYLQKMNISLDVQPKKSDDKSGELM